MNEDLILEIEKYYSDEWGGVLPKNISIPEFTKLTLNPDRIVTQFELINHSVKVINNSTILDYGAGMGDLVIFLKRKGYNAYGYEIDKRLYDISLKRDNGEYASSFLFSEDKKIPLPDNFFDLVISNFVAEHVLDLKSYILEALRVVKPGGNILITTCNYQMGFEFHASVFLPLFSRRLSKIVLQALGRKSNYLDSINFLTPRYLKNVLKEVSREYKIKVVDEGSNLFLENVFSEYYHSKIFISAAKVLNKLMLLNFMSGIGLYNPIILLITKL